MRVPVEWLKDYVAIRLKPETLAERLTMAGLEVTGIEQADGETVLVLEVTPNRADCLSIIGIAREVAAMTGQRLKLPPGEGSRVKGQGKFPPPATRHPSPSLTIRIEDRKGCQRYIGRWLEGVRIGPSPAWMQRRLSACGIRAINNVVDTTNYVLLEYGQPLHAFDVARLAERTILVRRATPKEPLTTLDGIRRELSTEMLVIADAKQAVAVAGVMGGVGTEVTVQTTAVLLESALFDPRMVRRTARALGVMSESSYRFERGVDPVGVGAASARASALICELAGGTERLVRDVGVKPAGRTVITLESSRANRWLGVSLSPSTMRSLLAKLSCRVLTSGSGEVQRVTVPSFRRDLVQAVDLYEELARMVGYDRLPRTMPRAPVASEMADASAAYWRLQSLRCLCASLGLTEALTWALVSEADLSRLGVAVEAAARVANPLSQDHACLRPSLLSGLWWAVRRNLTQGALSVRLFEVGQVFALEAGAAREAPHMGIVLSGLWSRDWRTKEPCDFFRLKGIVEALVSKLCDGVLTVEAAPLSWAEPGQGARLSLNGRPLGVIGQVAGTVAHAMDIEQDVWAAELAVETLVACTRGATVAAAPSNLPPVKRDLSFLVDDQTAFDTLTRTIREVGGQLASRVELIDRYTGAQVPTGQCSLTVSIEYRDPSRTLTADEVDTRHQQIRQALVQRFGARLR